MQWFDYVLIGLVVISVSLAIYALIKQKKRGGCSGCSSCPYADKCKKSEKKE